jgi:hypothetical protein
MSMYPYIEDTREPENRKPIGMCIECDEPLYDGDTVVDVPAGYICNECKADAALKYALRDEMKEFIETTWYNTYTPKGIIDLKQKFADWFYEPNIKILGEDSHG